MDSYSVEAVLKATGASDFTKSFNSAVKSVERLQDASSRIKDVGSQIGSVGRTLTNKITKPATIATGAVGGLVGALGFGRLKGADEARAKLEGLGYSAKDVERISKQVETAIEGGMTTMAEGTDIAAGALAAGVEEGKELERYIKLVGDAAVGANRPVGEMARIFNRVQGSGKLTRNELDMIEHSMPGFSQAMAEHVGAGSLEAFREMVSAGEVGSSEFLDVVEDFAGGMADAYSKSWSGMAKNTLAYVGIIGEALLEGLFEDGKEGLANFIELLKSDEVLAWAERTGKQIQEVARVVVSAFSTMRDWFTNLSKPIQDLIVKFSVIGAVVAVALGPVLSIVGAVVNGVGTLIGALGALFTPLGLTIATISALVASIIYLWETNDDFRVFVAEAWESIKETITEIVSIIVEHVKNVWGSLVGFWREHGEEIANTAVNVFETVWEIVEIAFEHVKTIITTTLDVLVPFFEKQLKKIEEFWEDNGENIMTIVETAFDFIKTIIEFVMPIVEEKIRSAWQVITTIFDTAISTVMGTVEFFSSMLTGDFEGMKNSATRIFRALWDGIKGIVSGAWRSLSAPFRTLFNNIKDWFTDLKDKALNWGGNMITGFADGISEKARNAVDAAKGVVDDIAGYLKFWSPAKKGEGRGIVKWGANMVEGFLDGVESQSTTVKRTINNLTKDFQPALMSDIALDPNVTTSIEHDINHNSQGGVYEFNIEIPLDGRTLAKQTVRFTAEELEMIKVRDRRR